MVNLRIIKDLAEEQKISIRDLADLVGVKENQIHVMCRTNSTKIDTLEKIAQVLNVHISEFFDDMHTNNRQIKGNNNQLNEKGAHDNINGGEEAILFERIKSLEEKVADREDRLREKDERIAELKERIAELKEAK